MKTLKIAAAVALTMIATSPAFAGDWQVEGRVLMVEPTYMPDRVTFVIDQPAGTCTAGSLLGWPAQGGDAASKAINAQAVLATLLTAKTSGQKIWIDGVNAGCRVDYLHLQ